MTEEVDSCSSVTGKHYVHSIIHRKRKLFSEEECSDTASSHHTHDPPRVKFEMEEFGSVTKEIEALHTRRLRLFHSLIGEVEARRSQRLQLLSLEQIQALRLKLSNRSTVESELDVEKMRNEEHFKSVDQKYTKFPRCGVIKLEDDSPISKVMAIDTPVEILDSDDEDNGYKRHTEVETFGIKVESNDKECRDQIHGHIGEIDKPGVMHDSADKDLGHEMHSHHYQKVVDESSIKFPVIGVILSLSSKSIGPRGAFSSSALAHACTDVITDKNVQEKMFEKEKAPKDEVGYLPVTCDTGRGKSAYASTENHMVMNEDKQLITSVDGLTDIWKDMAFVLESSKGLAVVPSTGEHMEENGEECDHSFVLKNDIGSVCRICGVIDRSIDTIFEFLYPKGRRSTRTTLMKSDSHHLKVEANLLRKDIEDCTSRCVVEAKKTLEYFQMEARDLDVLEREAVEVLKASKVKL